MTDSGTPVRRVRWFDLVTPQVLGLGAPSLALSGFLIFEAMTGGTRNAASVQGWLQGFTGLNLLLDLSNLLVLGMGIWILSRVTDPALPARFRPLTAKSAGIGVAAGLVAVIASTAIEYVSDTYLHTDLAQDGLATAVLPHDVSQLALGLFTVAILAPLTEEVYFRGIVMGWMRRHWGIASAVALSSLVFGLMHLKWFTPGGLSGWIATGELIAMGVLLAVVALRTGSLWASVLTHAVNNFCAALAAVFLAQ
ncbi:MAG TPA: CPBP family intramembrane glutamic endopeptidase [Rhizomicrobium sp.]